MEIYAPLAERIGMDCGEDRAADTGFRAIGAGSVRHHPGSVELPARPGCRRDRRGPGGTQACLRGRRRKCGRGGGAGEVALLDLGEDASAECRVRAALRHHGVPHRRADQGSVLWRAGRGALVVSSDCGAVQGLHFYTEIEWLSEPAHRRDAARAAQPEDRDPDPHRRHERRGRERRCSALGLQGSRQEVGREAICKGSGGCRTCWRSWRIRQRRMSSWKTPSWNSMRTRCSASRRRDN